MNPITWLHPTLKKWFVIYELNIVGQPGRERETPMYVWTGDAWRGAPSEMKFDTQAEAEEYISNNHELMRQMFIDQHGGG